MLEVAARHPDSPPIRALRSEAARKAPAQVQHICWPCHHLHSMRSRLHHAATHAHTEPLYPVQAKSQRIGGISAQSGAHHSICTAVSGDSCSANAPTAAVVTATTFTTSCARRTPNFSTLGLLSEC